MNIEYQKKSLRFKNASNYYMQVLNYKLHDDEIKKAFGLELTTKAEAQGWMRGFHYTKYLNDSEDVLKDIQSIKEYKKEDLIIADTGAGKTYTLFNSTNEDEWNIGVFPYWSMTDHNSNKYNIQRLVGGDFVDVDIETQMAMNSEPIEIFEGVFFDESQFHQNNTIKRFACLMDKTDEMQRYIEDWNRAGGDLMTMRGIVWVDEAHVLISSTYRQNAINKVFNFLDFIRNNTSLSIIYTTATPFNCQLLPYQTIHFYDKYEEKSNIKKVDEYICKPEQKIEDMLITHLKKAIKNNKKVILRVNDINLINNIKETFKNVDCITGENKGVSKVFAGISQNSTLNLKDIDILCLTCVLDAGVSIDKVEGCNIEDIVNIFIIDEHIDMNELKQFSNRLRFDTTLTLLVDKHHFLPEENYKDFQDVVEKKGKKYGEYFENFTNMYECFKKVYKDDKMASRKMRQILNERDHFGQRNDLDGIYDIDFKTNTLIYNYFRAFNRVWDEFQSQYFYNDEMRWEFLKNTFLVDTIGHEDIEYGDKFIDYVDERVNDVLENVKTDKELQDAIVENDKKQIKKILNDKYEIKDTNTIVESKKFEKLQTLIKYVDCSKAAATILDNTSIEVGKIIKSFERERLQKLTDQDLLEIKKYIDTKSKDLLSKKAIEIIESEYFEIYEDAVSVGIEIEKIQEIIKGRGVKEAKDYIREEIIIKNNKNYEKKNKWCGQAAFEQYVLIGIIDKCKTGKTMNLNDKAMGKISKSLTKKTGKKWETKDVENFIKMVYTWNKIDKGINIKGLRMNHTK